MRSTKCADFRVGETCGDADDHCGDQIGRKDTSATHSRGRIVYASPAQLISKPLLCVAIVNMLIALHFGTTPRWNYSVTSLETAGAG